MNETQLQKDILARILKGKKEQINYYNDFEHDTIWLCIEGTRVYSMPMDKFYINLELAGCKEFKGMKQLLDAQGEGYYLKITNELKEFGKKTCIKLHSDNYNITTWIDKGFLKPFKDIRNLSFKCKNKKSLVYVFEDDYLSAVMCPINVKE